MKRKRSEGCPHARKKTRNDTGSPHNSTAAEQYPLLTSCYHQVLSLDALLRDRLPATSRVRRKRLNQFDREFSNHSGFLNRTVVGISAYAPAEIQDARQKELRSFTQTQRVARGDSHEQRICDLGEMVDFAIWSLFCRDTPTSRTPSHLLCQGYQRTASLGEYQDKKLDLQLPGLTRRTPNPNVEALKRPPWTDIANLLGQDAENIMLTLLLDCGIFELLKTGQHNLYQVCGEPISQLTCILTDRAISSRSQPENRVTPSTSITFVRNRMLYARPTLNGQGKVQLGLKHIHVFNRYRDISDFSQDRRIMQYIFPLQFGLHNVFTCKPNWKETRQPLKDYTVREQEIALLDNKKKMINQIPRRLRGQPSTWVKKLRRNHLLCSYTQLLRHYCPIVGVNCPDPIPAAQNTLISSMISDGFLTQKRLSSTSPAYQEPSKTACTSSLIPHATPIHHVVAFCKAVFLRLVPQNTFGTGSEGNKNWSILLRSIAHFVEMRRFESCTLHEVCHGMSINCIDWLRPVTVRADAKVSATDRAKRLQLLQELIYYLFDSVLILLLRSNFYITETGVHRNRLYYFRHDVWKKMVEPSLAVLKLSMFEPLSSRRIKQTLVSNTLGCSQMRLMPKTHGTRPIMNLRRPTVRVVNGKPTLGPSINRQLAPIFSVLNYERHRQPARLASAMFSVGEIQHRLGAFKSKVAASGHKSFFFVKVDIRSCFDTIPQDELLTSIDPLLLEREYHVTQHAEVKHAPTGSSRAVTKYVSRTTAADGEDLLSSTTAAQLATRKRRHVFVGVGHTKAMKASQVKKILSDHVQQNIVRFGRKHFKQVQGIPQGSVLSSLLCNLFYGEFERQELKFLNPEVSLLLRLIDDFLLITTEELQARQFVHALARGKLKHGISVNAEKSLVNFEVSINGHKIPRSHNVNCFSYCGMIIDTQALQIRKDRQTKDVHVANGITINCGGRLGSILRNRFLGSLKRQLHAMLLDGSLNTRAQVLNSIFECFVESGMKMHQTLKSLPKHKRPTQTFLVEICSQLIDLGYRTLRRAQVQEPVLVTRSQMNWLATAALEKVLVRKQSDYHALLGWLHNIEARSRRSMDLTVWELKSMADSCVKPFAEYVY